MCTVYTPMLRALETQTTIFRFHVNQSFFPQSTMTMTSDEQHYNLVSLSAALHIIDTKAPWTKVTLLINIVEVEKHCV